LFEAIEILRHNGYENAVLRRCGGDKNGDGKLKIVEKKIKTRIAGTK
jgi:hypothetical protein